MKLQCTKKLLDQLKIKPESMEAGDERFSWHGNFLTVERRKMLVIVHDLTQYRIVFYGMTAKEWKNLNEVIREGIAKTWAAEGIKNSVIVKYLAEMGELTFTKTRDRSAVAKLNLAVSEAELQFYYCYEDDLVQVDTGKRASRMLVREGKADYYEPVDKLLEFLAEYAGEQVLNSTAAIMKIRMDFENLSVWRRVQVPLFLSFEDFHRVIQAVFEWENCHLHSFYLYGDLAKRNRKFLSHPGYHPEGMLATFCLVDNEETLAYGDPYVRQEMEIGKMLKDWMTDKMLYQYDFGDNWIHLIEVEEILQESEPPFVRCLDGEGATPPEDVGGEPGFERFMEAMKDESDSEHEFYKKWSEGHFQLVFDLERVNAVLKRLF